MNGRIILSIPTNLGTRQEIAAALADKYGTDYVFIGRIFRSTVTDESCEIDILPASARNQKLETDIGERGYELSLKEEFELLGQDKLDEMTLQQLGRCQQIIYLTSAEVGYQACVRIARLAGVLLEIAGIAIKLESADIAHSRDEWLSNYNSDDVFDLYSLFVVLIEGEEYYYSGGMHHFGKADVAIALTEDIGLAIYVMNVFNYYRLTESPILQDGHTFQPDIECPQYTMKWILDSEHSTDSNLYNSHGRWLLSVNS